MANRDKLSEAIKEAWEYTVRESYDRGLINSERGLQVYFVMHLIKQLERQGTLENRFIYIEPSIQIQSEKTIYPDLVICNRQNIIGLIELKYKPKKTFDKLAGVKKDLENLELFRYGENGASLNKVKLIYDRYLGLGMHKNTYPLSANCLRVWGGVFKESQTRRLFGTNKNCLQLEAQTSEGKGARIESTEDFRGVG